MPDGSYSYTLMLNRSTSAAVDNGVTTESNVETFTYLATDADGNITTSTIYDRRDPDDVPTAR